jgi:ATPase subunit of ABC transporter with duplicated ATPase domains
MNRVEQEQKVLNIAIDKSGKVQRLEGEIERLNQELEQVYKDKAWDKLEIQAKQEDLHTYRKRTEKLSKMNQELEGQLEKYQEELKDYDLIRQELAVNNAIEALQCIKDLLRESDWQEKELSELKAGIKALIKK